MKGMENMSESAGAAVVGLTGQSGAGKTTVFISHRLASTSFCDRTILIENGSICEEGTHNSLLGLKGKYYHLFEMQAKYYRERPDDEGVEE